MKCIEARRMVTPFINRELPEKEEEQFLRHIEHCEDCMEELDIYYTMYKAFDMLDTGAHHSYDFRKMLREEIRAAQRKIAMRRALRILRFALLVAAVLLLLLGISREAFRI